MLDRKITGNDSTAPKDTLIQRRPDWLAAEFLCSHGLLQDLLSFDLVTQGHGTLVTIVDILERLRKTGQVGKVTRPPARKFPNLLNTALDHVLADRRAVCSQHDLTQNLVGALSRMWCFRSE